MRFHNELLVCLTLSLQVLAVIHALPDQVYKSSRNKHERRTGGAVCIPNRWASLQSAAYCLGYITSLLSVDCVASRSVSHL